MRRWRQALLAGALLAFLAPAVAGLALWHGLQRLGEPPLASADVVSTMVLDRHGRLLRPFATPQGRWRLPTDVSDVDPHFIAMLLAYEDRRFHHHSGVDLIAVARALWQAVSAGRIVSGASTLTMQVARLIEPREDRTLAAKLRQMARAWQIEQRLSKPEILALYLRLAPYGGNLEGVRAASLAYFGKEPRRLATHEAALLVALPQSPEHRRPDRNPVAAKAARDRVLDRMAAHRLLAQGEAKAVKSRPVPTTRRAFPLDAPHLAQAEVERAPALPVHRLTIDRDLQRALQRLAAARARVLGPRLGLALVAVDHRSGDVLAHVGSPDYFDQQRAGQIDMTLVLRSPGSALKPFVYGLAIEAGHVRPATLIEDAPMRFGAYAPASFGTAYQGTVTVREALQQSLNVPAVQLLDAIGPERLAARLREAGAPLVLPGTEPPGLALALGGAGLRLMDLARLYAGLARLGDPVALRHRLDDPGGGPTRRLLSPNAAWLIGDILRGTPRPHHAGDSLIAFKTGTSYGYRDAWAAGFDGRHTVVVWVGRPDGAPSPDLTGIAAAAPVLFDTFARISPRRQPPPPAPAGGVQLASADLPPPLRHFRRQGQTAGAGALGTPPRIAFPPADARLALLSDADGHGLLALKADGGAPPLTWLVDGLPVASSARGRTTFWRPRGEGFAHLTVIDRNGRADSISIRLDRDP